MKCFVCGKEYTGHECPRCNFPDVQVPVASREEARRKLASSIDSYRTAFLERIRVEVIMMYWKDENGWISPDREESVLLGRGSDLFRKERWLDQQLARIENVDNLEVRLCIHVGSAVRNQVVKVPNLHASRLQQLGAALDEDFCLRLMLRNGSEAPTYSDPIPL